MEEAYGKHEHNVTRLEDRGYRSWSFSRIRRWHQGESGSVMLSMNGRGGPAVSGGLEDVNG